MPGRVEPIAELLNLPVEYGAASKKLAWSAVAERLETAPRYWLCTVARSGGPGARLERVPHRRNALRLPRLRVRSPVQVYPPTPGRTTFTAWSDFSRRRA